MEFKELIPAFGAEVVGFDPNAPLDAQTRDRLRRAFDRRGVLVFRDLDLDYPSQVHLSRMLVRKEGGVDTPRAAPAPDGGNWYISNRQEDAAAPHGRLQFHSDGMWADETFEVLSLYGEDVEPPSVPTAFVSGVHAWRTLPEELRSRVGEHGARHTAGEVGRGDLTDVLELTVERAPSTVKPLAYHHPRTGETVLYACEQMTKEVVDCEPEESEDLLGQLFAHMYDPSVRLMHEWRQGDLVVWDNIALQHARPNVTLDGPARTLRKVGYPMPHLEPDEMPVYGAAR